MTVPDYAMPEPRPGELGNLLRGCGMLALRYPTNCEGGIPAGLYVCRDRNYCLANVHASSRQAVRRGLRRCEIRPLERRELLIEGLGCNRDTMRRQGRDNREFSDAGRWERFVDAARQVPTIEATGAFVNGELAAYQIGCLDDGCWSILYSFSRTHLRHHHPNHALMFSQIQASIHRPGVSSVCAGPKTLLADDGLHAFKTRIGFEVESHEVVVRLHPLLEPFLSGPVTTGAVGLLRRALPNDLRLERFEAFLKSAAEARRFRGPQEPYRPELGAEHE